MSLVARWPLNGTARDAAFGKHDGTIQGDPQPTEGKVGKALSFDGAGDYVDIGPASRFNFTGEYSLSLWLQTEQTSSWARALMRGAHDQYQVDIKDNGAIRYRHYESSGGYSDIKSSSISAGRWYHVAALWDGSEIRLYLDGKPVGSSPVSSLHDKPSAALNIGRDTRDQNYWEGQIQDVRVYDHALSTHEVQELARGKVGHWPLSGGEAADITLQQNNGTISGDPQIVSGAIGAEALSFDGAGDAASISSSALDSVFSTGDFTVSWWMKFTSPNIEDVWNKADYPDFNRWVRAVVNYGGTAGGIHCGADDGSSKRAVTTDEAFNDGNWHHVVFRRDSGNGYALFVDGTQRAISSDTGDIGNAEPLELGPKTDKAQFTGSLDDFRVYATALERWEIKDLYEARARVDDTHRFYVQGGISEDSAFTSLELTNQGIAETPNVSEVGPAAGSLKHWWPLESGGENAAGGADGTVVGDPSSVSTPAGPGLDFDVKDEIVTDYDPVVPAGEAETTTMWVSFDDITSRYWFYGHGDPFYELGTRAGSHIQFYVEPSSGGSLTNIKSSSTFSSGVWHHVAAVVDNAAEQILLYVNGALEGTAGISGLGEIGRGNDAHIGGRADYSNNMAGQMADVRVYDRALSQEEIQVLYDLTRGDSMKQTASGLYAREISTRKL